MKKIILFLIVAATVNVFYGCSLINKLTQFNMPYTDTVTISSAVGVNLPFDIRTPKISSNSKSTFDVNNTRKDLIQQIKLSKLSLKIVSPSDGDFSFLKSIEIYISTDSLEEKKVAWNDSIPSDVGNEVILETTDEDLQEYIKSDSFTLRLHTVTNKIITSDRKIAINAVFFVDANILGI